MKIVSTKPKKTIKVLVQEAWEKVRKTETNAPKIHHITAMCELVELLRSPACVEWLDSLTLQCTMSAEELDEAYAAVAAGDSDENMYKSQDATDLRSSAREALRSFLGLQEKKS